MGLSSFSAIIGFGLIIAGLMFAIMRWHDSNCVKFKDEVDHLLEIARNDNLHG